MTITAKRARAIRDGIRSARASIAFNDLGFAPWLAVRMTLHDEPVGWGRAHRLYSQARLRTFAREEARRLREERRVR